LRARLGEYTRTLGNTEGALALLERTHARQREAQQQTKRQCEKKELHGAPIPYERVALFASTIRRGLERLLTADTAPATATALLQELREVVDAFLERAHARDMATPLAEEAIVMVDTEELDRLRAEAARTHKEIEKVQDMIAQHETAKQARHNEHYEQQTATRDMERELYAVRTEQHELRSMAEQHKERSRKYEEDREAFAEEVREGIALIGREVMGYKTYAVEHECEVRKQCGDRHTQHQRRRALERTKVRLETLGVVGTAEVQREYTEAKERDEFLRKELEDLMHSSNALKKLLREIDEELEHRFKRGIARITEQFDAFIKIMFGGGEGSVKIVALPVRGTVDGDADDDIEDAHDAVRTGVEIAVSLPKKRVHSLMMLSGGERTLTSIAFIFAMSQLNPPPFLILDETDAALDEANSRRYGDMIAHLSQKSQLIIITHNRETMARAGMLYGVTMAGDGVSRTISVKLAEAQEQASR
jgi:chromosome segregation protein